MSHMVDGASATAPQRGEQPVDVVVIGGGLAGTSTAIILAQAGHKVALVDAHAVYPSEFRAEKLGPVHMALFEKLGLGGPIRDLLTPMDEIRVYRFGRRVADEPIREYGFAYANLINGLRAALPPSVTFIAGKVAEVTTGPDQQHVLLTDGTAFRARLIVLATGLGDAVRRSVGIRKIETSKAHSLSLAFTLAKPAASYPFEALTYYGRSVDERIAYLTLFPIGDEMRANFFVYRQPGEAWTKAFRRQPQEMLCALMPAIADDCGGFAIKGPVEIRPIDLTQTEGYRRAGVVLLGDAYCTTCPAPGVGIQRVMTDVDRLCNVHLPVWLATPGMAAEKISAFYDDPVKRAVDSKAIAASVYARRVAADTGLIWRARRLRNDIARRLLFRLGKLRGASSAGKNAGAGADGRGAASG